MDSGIERDVNHYLDGVTPWYFTWWFLTIIAIIVILCVLILLYCKYWRAKRCCGLDHPKQSAELPVIVD